MDSKLTFLALWGFMKREILRDTYNREKEYLKKNTRREGKYRQERKSTDRLLTRVLNGYLYLTVPLILYVYSKYSSVVCYISMYLCRQYSRYLTRQHRTAIELNCLPTTDVNDIRGSTLTMLDLFPIIISLFEYSTLSQPSYLHVLRSSVSSDRSPALISPQRLITLPSPIPSSSLLFLSPSRRPPFNIPVPFFHRLAKETTRGEPPGQRDIKYLNLRCPRLWGDGRKKRPKSIDETNEHPVTSPQYQKKAKEVKVKRPSKIKASRPGNIRWWWTPLRWHASG